MTKTLVKGSWYTVTTASTCTITDANGTTLGTAEAGKQFSFQATTELITFSDDSATVLANPKQASVAAGNSSGGTTIQFDTKPTSGSTNAVTSGGLYNILYNSTLKLGNGTGGTGSNSINIGFGESRVSDSNSVGIGHNIWNVAAESVTIGHTARSYARASVVIGGYVRDNAYAYSQSRSVNGIVIGSSSTVSTGHYSMVIGADSTVSVTRGSIIGPAAKLNDESVMLLSVLRGSGVNTTGQTLLYLIAAGSPMANTYENGEACLGYVVKDSSGNILACGTRKLSELLTNNTAFAPAALDLDAPAPTPFLPTGITEPIVDTEAENFLTNQEQ